MNARPDGLTSKVSGLSFYLTTIFENANFLSNIQIRNDLYVWDKFQTWKNTYLASNSLLKWISFPIACICLTIKEALKALLARNLFGKAKFSDNQVLGENLYNWQEDLINKSESFEKKVSWKFSSLNLCTSDYWGWHVRIMVSIDQRLN